jgi:hypothetical protein
LENDHAYSVTPLISIRQQGKHRTFSGTHSFCNRHGPGGIHYKEDQVGGLFDAHFALEIVFADRKSQVIVWGLTFFLEGCRRPDGGIKGDI